MKRDKGRQRSKGREGRESFIDLGNSGNASTKSWILKYE